MRTIVFVISVLLIFSESAQASLTLPQIKAQAERAAARKAELDRIAREQQAALEKAAAEALAKAKEALAKTGTRVKDDVLDAKHRFIEEIVCEVSNLKTSDQVSGIIAGNLLEGKLTLKLGSVASEEQPGEKLAIRFVSSRSEDGDSVRFQIIDLNKPDQKLTRSVKLEQLGLQTECKKQKRVETLAEALPSVNDQTISKVLPETVKIIPLADDEDLLSGVVSGDAR